MRSHPWANSYNGEIVGHTKSSVMESSVKLPPISQVDCLGPHRVDEGAVEREHEANLAKIRTRQKRIIKPQSRKEREFGFARRKRRLPDFAEGSYPALSQVPMGSNPILEVPQPSKKIHHMHKRNINNAQLLPISQVSCLINSLDENPTRKPTQDSPKFHIHDSDSTYVKLSKSGGQHNLLHYVEAKPPLQRSLHSNYSPSAYGTLPALKSKSVQDPTWKPSQWAALSPIKKKEDHDDLKDK